MCFITIIENFFVKAVQGESAFACGVKTTLSKIKHTARLKYPRLAALDPATQKW